MNLTAADSSSQDNADNKRVNLRSTRMACPVHQGGGDNCEVRFDEQGVPRWASCYSHQCPPWVIMATLGGKLAPDVIARGKGHLDRSKGLAIARRLWEHGQELRGTLAERYLRSRGITIGLLGCLRFHQAVFHHRDQFRDYYYPALIACAEDTVGHFAGIHRTWLDLASSDFKLHLEPRKAALGTGAGSVVRLSAYLNPTIVLCEGIEDGLSIVQTTGLTTWACLGANMKSVRLPECVTEVILAGDNDAAGQKAIHAAAQRFHVGGRRVRVVFPPPGTKDFNDALRGGL